MYCKKCGKEIKENTKFCPGCGTSVGSTGQCAPPVSPYVPNSFLRTNNSSSPMKLSAMSPLGMLIAVATIVVAFIGTIGWMFLPLLKIKYRGDSETFSLFRLFDEGIDPSECPLIPIGLLVFAGILILNFIFLIKAGVMFIKKHEAKTCLALKNMLIGNAINYIFSLLMNINIQSEYFGSESKYVHISGFVIFMLLLNIAGAVVVTIISEDHLNE